MDKQHAHELLDQLGPAQFDAVARLLEVMAETPAEVLTDTPLEDEPISDEEERAVRASKEWLKTHPGIPFENVVAELGFTMDQIKPQCF